VVGTAGHIDHGKTTLLRALTGIDADRLPEERRRGMTIDVGYAHLALPDGRVIDFVDVPGHDRLVGNMLVGAGEIDAAMLVVAADDGPNAQTLEHLELLDALGIDRGLAVVTKTDLVDADRIESLVAQVGSLLARTTLGGVPVLVASAQAGEGIEDVRSALAGLAAPTAVGPAPRLAIDRVFNVRGRGTVVTGSLRGGAIASGDTLRLVPDGLTVRVREVQVRSATVDAAAGGRTALLLGGVEAGALERGAVLTNDPRVVETSRILVSMRAPAGLAGRGAGSPADRDRLRLHLGTTQADALVVRGPREAIDLPDGSALAILRLARPIAAAAGDRFALRVPSPGATAGGGVVLDPLPPRGISRRRLGPGRAAALVGGGEAARVDLHGALVDDAGVRLAPDVEESLRAAAAQAVRGHHVVEPSSPGMTQPALRDALAMRARRQATLDRSAADRVARHVVELVVADGTLARDGDRLRDPARAAGLPPDVFEAMDRLEAALAVAAPPPLAEAARAAGCPPHGVTALERERRIVRLEDDLARATSTWRDLTRRA
jgi:small GTP-binding protein